MIVPSPLDFPLAVTFFADRTASAKRCKPYTLRQLAQLVKGTSAADKKLLPWLKLAEFGDTPTKKGSYRYDKNVLLISGIEVDYDLGDMLPSEAVERLRKAGIAALLYTSPSHGPGKNRWRVLCPLSEMLPGEDRRQLAGRINGVLGGTLSVESFTLSQAYYYGSVGDNPAHDAWLVEGRFLDQATELESVGPAAKVEVPRIEVPTGATSSDTGFAMLKAACDLFGNVGQSDAAARHQTALAATQAVAPFILSADLDRSEAEAAIGCAMTDSGREPNEGEIESALDGALESAKPYEQPIAAADEFAAVPLPPTPDRFYEFRRGENPYGGREWLVHQTLPRHGVAFLAGQYAAGKTFAALDLSVGVMQGGTFAGLEIDTTGSVLYLAAEGEAEIPVRLEAIMRERQIDTPAKPFIWFDVIPVLLTADGEKRILAMVEDAAEKMKARGTPLGLVVVDTIGAAAGWDDENNAAEAQRAMRVLKAISIAAGALALAVDHFGKTQESGLRGSSAKGAGAESILAVLCDKQLDGATRNRRIVSHKVRGGTDGKVIPFALRPVNAGTDDRGRAVTTCVMDWTAQPEEAKADKLDPIPRRCLEILRDAITSDRPTMAEDDAVDLCVDNGASDAKDRKNKLRSVRIALYALKDRELVTITNGLIGLADDDMSSLL